MHREEVDAWGTQTTPGKNCRILKRQWRKQVECVTAEMTDPGQAVWREVRRSAHNCGIWVKELYACTVQLTKKEKH